MLNLYRAPASADTDALMFEKIAESLARIRSGEGRAKQVILVVPAQSTLASEEAAFAALGGEGFFDLHIVSGGKLRSDILKETGGPGRTAIDTLGRSMLLRKVARELAPELSAFGRVAHTPEFLKLAGDFIVQMKQNRFRAEDLPRMAAELPPESLLSGKLSDMQRLAEGYEAAMAGRFTDAEDELRFTTEKVGASRRVAESEIWYAGFYSFTLRETEFLMALAEHSAGLHVVLPCFSAGDPEGDAFASPLRTAAALRAAAAERGLGVRQIDLEGAEHILPPDRVRLVEASNPFSQAKTAAVDILRLVREKSADFGEIAVLTQDLASQGAILARVFASCGIPVFMDEKRSVMHTPAAELLAALLDMTADGLTADNVLRFLKPGLLVLPQDCADSEQFENYIKSYHIRGNAFLRPLRYGRQALGEELFARLERSRAWLADLLEPFLAAFDGAKTVREKTEVFYSYLSETLGLADRLQTLALTLSVRGFADAAEESAQVWDVFTGLLDQCVELLGDEPLDSAEYRDVLEGAFADIKIGVLPQSEGRVTLGSIDRSKLRGIKALYIIGVNEGILPAGPGSEGILTEREQQVLAKSGYVLAKSAELKQQEERFNIYAALTAPSEYLWVSYCLSDAAGSALRPSNLVGQIRDFFPGLTAAADAESAGDDDAFLERGAAGEKLAQLLRDCAAGEGELAPVWKEAFNVLREAGDTRLNAIRAGLLERNRSAALNGGVADALYAAKGGELRVSPSRLESFARCPFLHFVRYGLRPQEARDFSIDHREIGDIYHEILLRVSEWLNSGQKGARQPEEPMRAEPADPASAPAASPTWTTVTDAQLAAKIDEILADMSAREMDGLLSRGAEEGYRVRRIREVALRFARRIVSQLRESGIGQMYFETPFGDGDRFPAVRVDSPYGTVRVEGKIDRVDLLPGDDARYVKIVDYKSGKTSFDRELAAEGLSLQLMLYLEGALGSGDSKPAGVFYYHIDDPKAPAALSDLSLDRLTAEMSEALDGQYRFEGLCVDVPSVTAGAGDAKVVSEQEFADFQARFRESLEELCSRLSSGSVSVAPRKLGRDLTSCSYCDYRSICSFDKQLRGYRVV